MFANDKTRPRRLTMSPRYWTFNELNDIHICMYSVDKYVQFFFLFLLIPLYLLQCRLMLRHCEINMLSHTGHVLCPPPGPACIIFPVYIVTGLMAMWRQWDYLNPLTSSCHAAQAEYVGIRFAPVVLQKRKEFLLKKPLLLACWMIVWDPFRTNYPFKVRCSPYIYIYIYIQAFHCIEVSCLQISNRSHQTFLVELQMAPHLTMGGRHRQVNDGKWSLFFSWEFYRLLQNHPHHLTIAVCHQMLF